jgi:hypothetical protein
MSDTIGRITFSAPVVSGTFPLVSRWPYGRAQSRTVIVHQFGSGNAKIEQRFLTGDGAIRFLFKDPAMTDVKRVLLRDFYDAHQSTFVYLVPKEDGTTEPHICYFEDQPLSVDHLISACSVGITLVDVPAPSAAPVYPLTATVTRFPDGTLNPALLAQEHEIIPLVRIRVLDTEVPDIFLSDRRVTIGSQLYLPRLLRIGDPNSAALMTQSIDGSSDDVSFSFGNADRVMVQVANDAQLLWARIELSLFHVGTGIKLDLWAGYVTDWQSDAGPEMTVRCSDILSALTKSSPVGLVSRTCWRRLGKDGCLWNPASDTRDLVHFPSALTTKCDLGYNTPNGCLAHGAGTTVHGYGATYCSPQGVLLRSGSIGVVAPGSAFLYNPFSWVGFGAKSTWYARTSIIADTIYGQSLPEVWTNDDGIPQRALLVTCKIAAGRDEDEFYDALGVVGRGPLGAFTAPQMYDSDGDGKLDSFAGSTLDGQPNHGFQVDSNGNLKAGANATYGLRQVLGTDPAGTHDWFSLSRVSATGKGWFTDAAGPMEEVAYMGSAYNLVFAAGVAFCEIRRTKPPKDPLSSPGQHTMIAAVSQGLTGFGWTAPGARTTIPACTNPFWVAVNTFLSAIGLSGAAASTQEQYFDVASAVASAAIADTSVARIIGTGSEIQFRFKGSIDDRKPTRDWLQAVLNSGTGYYVWSFGKLKVGCRENASVVSAFTGGNMLFNTLRLAPVIPKFEKLTVSFADEEYQFQSNTIDLTDQDHAARNNRSQNPLAATFAISGCSTKSQAGRIAIVRSREELGGITQAEQDSARLASWKTTILALETEAGMVVSVADPDIPAGTGKFRIQRWSLNRDWSIEIQGRTVTDSMYDMTAGPKPADVTPAPIPGEAPHATGLPLPWSPGYVAPLVGDAVYPAGLSGPGNFGVQPVYGIDAQGNGTLSLAIKGSPPINRLSALTSAVLPPSIACVAGTSGSLAPGTYVVAVSAFDTGTPYANTGYSNQVTVTVPAGPSTGSIALTVTWQPGSNGGDIYMASTDSNHSFHLQAGLAAGQTTATVTSFNQSTAGGPDPKFDHLAVKWKKIIHGGVWAQQVQSRTGTVGTSPGTITIADPSNGTTLNQWAGYTLTLLAKYDTATEIKILNMPVLSNTAASGGLFVLAIGPNSVGDQLVDLTTLLDVGDLVVMRTKATFTPYGFSDPNIANSYYPSGMSGVEAGHLAMVMSGPDAGDVQTVGSVSLDSNGHYTVVNLAGAWEITPNTGDIVIVVEAAFSPEVKTQRFSIPNKGSFTGVVAQPNVLNLAGGAGAWLFLVATEDSSNARGSDSLAPVRELYFMGSGGTRAITASSTMLITDGLVECDTSAGDIVFTLLPFAQIPNRVIEVRKLTGDANTVTVQVDQTPGNTDAFPGGVTAILLTDNSTNYFVQIKVPG